MPTTEDEAGRPESQAAGAIERMQAEIGKLKSQIGVVLEQVGPTERERGDKPFVPRKVILEEWTWGKDTPRIIIRGIEPGFLDSIERASAGASKAEETDDSLTPDDLKEVMREALKLIDSNGLDSPEGHLEFVRGQLRAAVA
jgi:hypothetical protein